MNKERIKRIIVITLMVIEICTIHLSYKSFTNKPVELDDVKLREIETPKKSTYAIMISDGNGGYTESNEDKFPTEGYKLNLEKSGCIDNSGNKISGGGLL